MKLRTILASSLLVATTFSANAEGFLDSIKNAFGFGDKEVTEQVQTVAEANTVVEDIKEATGVNTDLLGYASEQLGLSSDMTSGALGALFKVAQDNLGDNFSSISDVIPNVDSYIESAPAIAKSSLGGLASSLGGDELGQAAAGLSYLNSAFEKLGIPKETILPLVNTVTGYLEANDYGTAASMLKQGVNFL